MNITALALVNKEFNSFLNLLQTTTTIINTLSQQFPQSKINIAAYWCSDEAIRWLIDYANENEKNKAELEAFINKVYIGQHDKPFIAEDVFLKKLLNGGYKLNDQDLRNSI